MNEEITETLERVQKMISEEISRKVENCISHYGIVIAERDREIAGLREALKQSAIDFKRLQERTNGDKPCCQSSTSNS